MLKIDDNVERDGKNKKTLRNLGYKAIVLWEQDINKKSETVTLSVFSALHPIFSS